MATSKLQRYTSKKLGTYLGKYAIRENNRPAWLTSSAGERLELDLFIKELSIGIEVQGNQHFFHVPFFHSKDDFKNQKRRDKEKARICRRNGVTLFYVSSYADVMPMIHRIYKMMPEGGTEFIPLPIKNKIKKHLRSIACHHKSNPDVADRAYNEIVLLCRKEKIKTPNLLGLVCQNKKDRKLYKSVKESPYF